MLAIFESLMKEILENLKEGTFANLRGTTFTNSSFHVQALAELQPFANLKG